MNIYRKKIKNILIIVVASIFFVATINLVIDPYFHFHKPIRGMSYAFSDERLVNDGISRHFDYDAIIAGTSMVQCFKNTEFDDIFDVKSIKLAYSGGKWKEVNDGIKNSIKHNNGIKLVVRGLDYEYILTDKDAEAYHLDYSYMTDDNVINDLMYVLNFEVFEHSCENIGLSLKGSDRASFDKMNFWADNAVFGKEVVLSEKERLPLNNLVEKLSEEDICNIEQTLQQNVLNIVKDNPQVDFYYFYTPYSILFFDDLNQTGKLTKQLQAEEYANRYMLTKDLKNLFLFSFFTDTDTICDLDNYKDRGHYRPEVNSNILDKMKNKEYELTMENIDEYSKKVYDFFTNYDYDKIYE